MGATRSQPTASLNTGESAAESRHKFFLNEISQLLTRVNPGRASPDPVTTVNIPGWDGTTRAAPTNARHARYSFVVMLTNPTGRKA